MPGKTSHIHRGARRLGAAAALAAGLVAAIAFVGAPATAPGQGSGSVHVTTSGWGSERLKTVPIGRSPRSKQRVVMSLGPKRLGRIHSGDRVEGMAELEVSTTCLERMPKCVGRIYRFSPYIHTRLVLARGPNTVKGRHVKPITRWRKYRCSQEQPHRNHHCVIVVPPNDRAINDASKLPCDAGRCHLNMVVSAYHPGARRGHKLVIGVDDNHGISQNKSHLSAARFSPHRTRFSASQIVQRRPRMRSLKIGPPRSGAVRKKVVFSRRLDDLRAGESLVVEARAIGGISHLSYATLLQSQLVLSSSPGSTKRSGPPKRIGSFQAQFGLQNGFNCTRGHSAHSNPCKIRKVGVMKIIRDARATPWKNEGRRIPVYVNLVVGARAVGVHDHRYRGGDRVRIKGGGIKIRRYGP